MRTIVGFLLGAAAVAMVTTERGRRFAADLTDELEGVAKDRIRELKDELVKTGDKPENEKEDSHA